MGSDSSKESKTPLLHPKRTIRTPGMQTRQPAGVPDKASSPGDESREKRCRVGSRRANKGLAVGCQSGVSQEPQTSSALLVMRVPSRFQRCGDGCDRVALASTLCSLLTLPSLAGKPQRPWRLPPLRRKTRRLGGGCCVAREYTQKCCVTNRRGEVVVSGVVRIVCCCRGERVAQKPN